MTSVPTEAPLQCRCGLVRGRAVEVSPSSGMRVVCYCSDCQAYARFLETPDVMDEHGGTDILQMAASRLRITEGIDQLRCMRLSEKGLLRWYTDCCRTPVANTISGKLPFAGVVHSFVAKDFDAESLDKAFGKPIAHLHAKTAGRPVPSYVHPTAPPSFVLRIAKNLMTWWLTGKGTPSPLFDTHTKQPILKPRVLTPAERDALRPAASS